MAVPKIFWTVLFSLIWIVAGCGEQTEIQASPKNPPQKIRLVKIHSVRATPYEGHIEYVGTLTAHRKVNVATELGGSIEKLFFEKGAEVKKGQLLARVSTSSIRLEVRQARAALGVAKSRQQKVEQGSRPEEIRIAEAALKREQANLKEAHKSYERIKGLYGMHAVSDSQYDTAKRLREGAQAGVELAREQLELAKQGPRVEDRATARAQVNQAQSVLAIAGDRLHKSQIYSPCDGIAAFRRVEEGEIIAPGTIITQIVDNSRMKLNLALAEKDIPLLARDKPFTFTIDAIAGRQFRAQLVFLSPTADPATRAFPVELLVNELDARMADGMTARVKFPLGNTKASIKVLTAWLREANGHLGLFVFEDGKAVFRKADLGAYYEQKVEILSGLKEEDLVIVNPAGLKDGDTVALQTKAGDVK